MPRVTHQVKYLGLVENIKVRQGEFFMYRYILPESCSQFDSLPLTSLTIFLQPASRSAPSTTASWSDGASSRRSRGPGRTAARTRRHAWRF